MKTELEEVLRTLHEQLDEVNATVERLGEVLDEYERIDA